MGKRRKKSKNKGMDDPAKRLQLMLPVPDDRPNWPERERHEVMMSVTMDHMPPRFEDDYIAVICPVAKRRTVVAYGGWTCSYNKLLNMDRKFQSALPGGNLRYMQFVRHMQDLCILDCLHLKAERTFYIMDLMVWKQIPYYETETGFRFHWIAQMSKELDLNSINLENEYHFKAMPRVPCNPEDLYQALDQTKFKVDGILFFHREGLYNPGSTNKVLWLPPEDIERVLGMQPPQHVFPTIQRQAPPLSTTATAATSAASAAGGDVGGEGSFAAAAASSSSASAW